MMRYILMAALLAISLPAAAQDSPSLTPDEEMQCALLAANAASQTEDPAARTGLGVTMAYWFGRYEGRTGRTIEQGATVEMVQTMIANAATLAPRCQAEAERVGQRFQNLGRAMSNFAQEGRE